MLKLLKKRLFSSPAVFARTLESIAIAFAKRLAAQPSLFQSISWKASSQMEGVNPDDD